MDRDSGLPSLYYSLTSGRWAKEVIDWGSHRLRLGQDRKLSSEEGCGLKGAKHHTSFPDCSRLEVEAASKMLSLCEAAGAKGCKAPYLLPYCNILEVRAGLNVECRGAADPGPRFL